MTSGSLPPSTAARPDLDWSQIRETLLMLNLAMAQIEMAMKESGSSVEMLTSAFTGMSGSILSVLESARSLPDSPVRQAIEATSNQISARMQEAIIALQFYDRLSQRLSHVCRNLEELSVVVGDPARLYNPAAWHALQQHIRAKYTMEDEKLMFDTLLATGSVEQALERYLVRKHEQHTAGGPDVELF